MLPQNIFRLLVYFAVATYLSSANADLDPKPPLGCSGPMTTIAAQDGSTVLVDNNTRTSLRKLICAASATALPALF